MGLFSGFMNYIDEDTIRMKSSEGKFECEELLENASDDSLLDYTRAYVRMCNKGKEPRGYFFQALCSEISKRPTYVRRQAFDILKKENYASDIPKKENHASEQKRADYRAMAWEMPTQELQKKSNNADSDMEKEAYLAELQKREEHREKAVKLSVNDLEKHCRDVQKGRRKIVYQEEILKRRKAFSKLEKDYVDVAERIEKLKDLYECDIILKEDYESKRKEWSEELEKAKEVEHQRLLVDLEKDIPDVEERIKKLKELHDIISKEKYENKLKEWDEELEKAREVEHQKLFADLEKNTPDVVARIKKLEELYGNKVISQNEYESKIKEWGEELETIKAVEHQKLFADLEKDIPDVVERIKKLKELYDNAVISQKEYEEKKYDWLS